MDDDRRGLACFIPETDDDPHCVHPGGTKTITLMNTSYEFMESHASGIIAQVLAGYMDESQTCFFTGRLGIEHALSLDAVAF